MDKTRFFGECPCFTYSGAMIASIVVQSTQPAGNSPAMQSKGYATILVLTDTVFTALTFAHAIAGSVTLTTPLIIPAGTTLYGVRSYQVFSGSGIAYHSIAI